MGCSGMTKEKLQTEILVLQLEKAEIQEERERLLYQLKILNKKKNLSFSQNESSNSEVSSSKCATNQPK